jgi:putative membrane protein
MTYFCFLFRFLIVPILILLAITWWETRKGKSTLGFEGGRKVWIAILIHVFLAVVYTTPWDNYLVATGVWSYNPELVTGIVIGFVPIEEYIFFVLETILAGLWWWFLARRSPPHVHEFRPNKKLIRVSATALVCLWVVFTVIFFGNYEPLTYLSITLFWALPAILPQIIFGADILSHHRKLVALAILVPGVYLSVIDIFALSDTTWSISREQTTGMLFLSILPLEEIVFFVITNTLIVFGMTLLLSRESQSRLGEIKKMFERYLARTSGV